MNQQAIYDLLDWARTLGDEELDELALGATARLGALMIEKGRRLGVEEAEEDQDDA